MEFLHEGKRIEISKGTKRHTFVAFSAELTQTVKQRMYIAAHTQTECLSCSVSCGTAQFLYRYCKNIQYANELCLQ